MRLSKCAWLLALLIVIFGSTSALAQTRIQLVQGRRLIKDKVTFVVDVSPEKIPNPRYATAPEDLHIYTRFTEHPGTGMVYLDGKTLGRFDEAMSFHSNSVDIAYGRHTLMLVVTNPTIVFDFLVDVRGGVAREVFDSDATTMPQPSVMEQRILELERKVHELEAEVATLKKNRAQ